MMAANDPVSYRRIGLPGVACCSCNGFAPQCGFGATRLSFVFARSLRQVGRVGARRCLHCGELLYHAPMTDIAAAPPSASDQSNPLFAALNEAQARAVT